LLYVGFDPQHLIINSWSLSRSLPNPKQDCQYTRQQCS
jgi:hypothetical protein